MPSYVQNRPIGMNIVVTRTCTGPVLFSNDNGNSDNGTSRVLQWSLDIVNLARYVVSSRRLPNTRRIDKPCCWRQLFLGHRRTELEIPGYAVRGGRVRAAKLRDFFKVQKRATSSAVVRKGCGVTLGKRLVCNEGSVLLFGEYNRNHSIIFDRRCDS